MQENASMDDNINEIIKLAALHQKLFRDASKGCNFDFHIMHTLKTNKNI